MCCALGRGSVERVVQDAELFGSSDHRRVEVARDRFVAVHRDEPVSGNALGFAFQLERLDDLNFDGVAHEPVGGITDQHLVCRRVLLEASGRVHGISGDEVLARRSFTGDDFAGVHTGPVL